jgi:TatD DNase family protein
MSIKFIDSHAHLTSSAVYPEVDEVLVRAKTAGLEAIVNICTDALTLERGIELAKKYPWIYNTAATTPHDVEKEGEQMFSGIAQHARSGNLVAIGETGLDYHYNHSAPEIQRHFLKRYLHLALECHLPIVIHCRDAFKDFFEILDAEYLVNNRHAPGVLHCFTGTIEEAQEVLDRGWYLSLSGIVTFKKSEELREVAKMTPLSQLLIETDTPYLAPQGKRGRQNEPSYLPETASLVAKVKNIPLEELAKATVANAMNLFQI